MAKRSIERQLFITRGKAEEQGNSSARVSEIYRIADKIEILQEFVQSLIKEVEALESSPSLRTTPPCDFNEEVTRYEIQLIESALKHAKGNQTRAAQLLNIKVNTLHHKIKLYRIDTKIFKLK